MIIGKVQISGTCARTIYCKAIPKDIVGAKVAIEYDDALWDGLTKKAVFTNGIQTKERADPGALVSMPPEILDTVGAKVRIGVCGTSADGELVIPTLWATLSVVQDAVPVEADEAAEPTPPIWAQLMGMIGNLDDLDTDARKNLVAAVNELVARGGEIDAAEVQQIVDAYLAAKVPEVKLPEALPNPHPLRLTGAVEATYDGSEAVAVVIPQGGGGGWKEGKLIGEIVFTEDSIGTTKWDFDCENISEIYVYAENLRSNQNMGFSVKINDVYIVNNVHYRNTDGEMRSHVWLKEWCGSWLAVVSEYNYTTMGRQNGQIPCGTIPHGLGLANKITISQSTVRDYQAFGGTIRIYGR